MAQMAHMFRAMGQEAPVQLKPILEINPKFKK